MTGGDTIKRGVRSGGTVSAEGGREMARSEKVSEGHGGEMWGDGVPVEARRDDHIVERESRPSPPPSCVDLGRREAGWGESECAAKARGVCRKQPPRVIKGNDVRARPPHAPCRPSAFERPPALYQRAFVHGRVAGQTRLDGEERAVPFTSVRCRAVLA